MQKSSSTKQSKSPKKPHHTTSLHHTTSIKHKKRVSKKEPLSIIKRHNTQSTPITTNTTLPPSAVQTIQSTRLSLDRTHLDQLLLHKMIFVQSYEIYGGSAGLYDYGPTGSAIMANIRQQWRKQFIKAERMLEFSGSTLTPEAVLRSSGHLERFTDWMTSTKEPEKVLPTIDEVKASEDGKKSKKKDKKDTQAEKPFESEHIRTDKIVEDCLDDLIENLTKAKNDNTITPEQDELLTNAIQDRAIVGGLGGPELDTLVQKYSITHNGYQLHPSSPFNLMFATQFGPSGKSPYYFRPETAQGIFVNFQRLFNQNNNQLPFSVAQVGTAYRNEIAPRNAILRTREFTQAEIEHFVDPLEKDHPKFHEIKNRTATFLSAKHQLDIADGVAMDTSDPTINENGQIMSFEDAVHGKKVVDNESLGYFLSKTLHFLKSIGVHENKVRFRQHLPTEMAHYATDCWDAEILTTFGWVECVGHADRSAHDLTVHANATKTELYATKHLDPPEIINSFKIAVNKGKLVPLLKPKYNPEQMGKVMQFLSTASQESILKIKDLMIKTAQDQGIALPSECNGDWSQYDFVKNPITVKVPLYDVDENFIFEIGSEILNITPHQEKIHTKHFTPHVIEPSFGLARIFYSVLEHSFSQRVDDEQRRVLQLPPEIAPYQIGIYPVASNLPRVKEIIRVLEKEAIDLDMAVQVDDSKASIGKKYSRWDENGVPFAITLDSLSVPNGDDGANTNTNPTVTIRERDSCEQIRLGLDQAMGVVHGLVKNRMTWETACQRFGKVGSTPNGEEH